MVKFITCVAVGILTLCLGVAPLQAQETDVPSWKNYDDPQTNAKLMASPHMSQEEITTWAEQAVIETLTFTGDTYMQRFEEYKKYFTGDGFSAYARYLVSARIFEKVLSGNQSVNAVQNGEAIMLKEGNLQGVYRWQVQVPVMLSFYKPSIMGDGQLDLAGNGKFKLILQLRRINQPTLTDAGVAIESWELKPSKKKG